MEVPFVETKAFEDLYSWLRLWTPGAKKFAIVYGGVGVGKTRTIVEATKRLGVELRRPRGPGELLWLAYSPGKYIIYLDRPLEEGLVDYSTLKKAGARTRHPIVIETDNVQRYRRLGGFEVEVKPPSLYKLSKALREKGLSLQGVKMVGDLRQLLMAVYGAVPVSEKKWLDRLTEFLQKGDASGLEQNHLPAVLDTWVENCYGLECCELLSVLVAVDLTGRPRLLQGHRLSRPVAKPSLYFYAKLKAIEES